MKNNKEIITGILVTLCAFVLVAAFTGIYGLLYIGLAFVIAIISLNLFSRRSLVAKTGAVILNSALVYKILMPGKYKKEIKALKEQENNEKI